MGKNNSFTEAIEAYLEKRAAEDALFAACYAKEGKSVKECCDYIMGEAKKRGSAVCMTDEEVYGLAVHYYDEDGIDVKPVQGARVEVRQQKEERVELTEEEKKAAREAAIRKLTEEQYAQLKKKPAKKRVEEPVQQMSLF